MPESELVQNLNFPVKPDGGVDDGSAESPRIGVAHIVLTIEDFEKMTYQSVPLSFAFTKAAGGMAGVLALFLVALRPVLRLAVFGWEETPGGGAEKGPSGGASNLGDGTRGGAATSENLAALGLNGAEYTEVAADEGDEAAGLTGQTRSGEQRTEQSLLDRARDDL